MRTLVIGKGLIGTALAQHDGCVPLLEVPWGDTTLAEETLAEACLAWMLQGGPWAIAWCAGVGVVGSDVTMLEKEHRLLAAVLHHRPRGRGRILLTSSGGGVYGGCDGVIDESTDPNPVSAYGRAKMQQESAVGEYSERWDIPVVIVRPSNVYGPFQNPAKPQGLITKVLRSLRDATPFGLTVPMDTERDYIYASDVGYAMARLLEEPQLERVTTRLVASGQSKTIRDVISAAERATGRRLIVEQGSPNTDQPRRLAFAPSHGSASFTPFHTGIIRTWSYIQGSK